jgi:hypothetical protein
MQETIRYDVAATLQKWPSLRNQRAGNSDLMRVHTVFNGALAGRMRELQSLSAQRHLYDIFTEEHPGPDKTILEPSDIVELAERPGFPRMSNRRP